MNPSCFPGRERRDFLLKSACAIASAGGLGAALSSLRLTQLAAQAQGGTGGGPDYKALVCLFMYGGNDSNNTLVPRTGDAHAEYAAIRANIAIPADQLIPVHTPGGDGQANADYGIPNVAPELIQLHQAGQLAWVANVGSLVAPMTANQFAKASLRPYQVFSHREQMEQWQTSIPEPSQTGWGGRLADQVRHLNGDETGFMSISLGGANFFEVGRHVYQYGMTPAGAVGLEGVEGSASALARGQALGNLVGRERNHLLEQAYAETVRGGIDQHAQLSTAFAGQQPLQTDFPDNPLGQQLRMISQLIDIRSELGLTRQVFFCGMGGFDTHDNQLEAHPELLAQVSSAVGAFQTAMVELGCEDKVTLFSASDFNRTMITNGRGTDHAWGGHHFVVGGAVQGGRIYGRMPVLELDGPDDVGAGRFVPTTAVDEYAATLAQWFGVPENDLEAVVPNIGRFATRDLGFMA